MGSAPPQVRIGLRVRLSVAPQVRIDLRARLSVTPQVKIELRARLSVAPQEVLGPSTAEDQGEGGGKDWA